MSAIKQTLSVSVPISEVMLHGVDAAAAKALNAAFKENGVPDGIRVEVEVTPRKHDYEARATWQNVITPA